MHICYLHKRHKRLLVTYLLISYLLKKVLTSLIKINCKVQDLRGGTSISKLLIEAENEKERTEMPAEWESEQMFDRGDGK